MTVTKLFDARWIGTHGIGRFANEIFNRVEFERYEPMRSLLSPLEPWRIGRDLARRPAGDGYFSPGFNAVLGTSTPYYLTVHDLIHLRFSAEVSLPKRAYYHLLLKRSLQNAARVLTVSEFSRAEICNWVSLPSGMVTVVGNGVSESFRIDGPARARDRPYILYVGNQKQHKNFDGLLAAYRHARARHDFDLLATGTPLPETGRAIDRLGLCDRVHWLGVVDDDTLAAVYRGAQALILPSLYEGFGLPVIEAMACGTPVLCSNAASLPEVAGGQAVLFNGRDTCSIIAALDRLYEDTLMAELRQCGPVRASKFTWQRVADNVSSALL